MDIVVAAEQLGDASEVARAGAIHRRGDTRKVARGNASYQTATRVPEPLPFT